MFGRRTNGQESLLWSPITIECCNLLYSTWKPSLTWAAEWCFVADCRKQSGMCGSASQFQRLFIDSHADTYGALAICSLGHYQAGLSHYADRHIIKTTHTKTQIVKIMWKYEAHPCPSSVSREILTLLLHHWRLHPLITISCISRWSQARLTSLTRPLSLTMLIRMGRTLGMNVCVYEGLWGNFFFCNCQGLDDFPLACLMRVHVCAPSCHGLTYRMRRPIQHTARQVWHCVKGSVNWDGVCLCPMMRPISAR